MELLHCPICEKEGLMQSNLKFAKERIVCSNEWVQHVRIGMVDLLIRTEKAVQEEKEENELAQMPN